MDNLSYLNGANAEYIDSIYQAYKENPAAVEFGWQKFFEGFDFGRSSEAGVTSEAAPEHFLKEVNVLNLINGYRQRGHLFTKTNPVRERRHHLPTLDIENFGLSKTDLDTVFNSGVELGIGAAKLSAIVAFLEKTYCGSVGAEYKFVRTPEVLNWIEQKMERVQNTPNFSIEEKRRILKKLNEAVSFENFLGTKFLGQKRFSLEGAESLIPALDSVIEKGAELGIEEFVIGMAHRGRLNVLANIMQKTYQDIFAEFEGKGYSAESPFGGDVKYHLGYSTDVTTNDGKSVHLSLCPNPSHLETVNGVVEGMTRSKIDFKYDGDNARIAPILIHGDASVAGQGIVYEVIQMAGLDGYKTGGTIHLVINNQIGFTTNYKDARTSTYCTDIAKVTLSPVFHVNGDDPEALVYAINLAMEYRQKYKNDVFIDILCYRRFGHNESDEPKFTQPLLYKTIEKHANPRDIYVQQLISEGKLEAGMAKEMEVEFRGILQQRLNEAKEIVSTYKAVKFAGAWSDMRIASADDFLVSPDTAVDKSVLLDIAKKISTLPAGKKFFKKIEKLFGERNKMATSTHIFDWAMGEQMAYATLLEEGKRVRLSGQDVERGTFSHRHAVLTLEDSEEEYIPLANLDEKQASFDIYNSHLSEYGVLGFEYGYAMANPNALTIWEAQFGDFFNGAQIVVDQYIASAETKWQRENGLVMLLPHGYEGQGPEHSSARIERFMELCADYNMQVTNCTTPANFFHAIRRQFSRDFRKPLIVFTPKSLLRHPLCVSPLEDFTNGKFKEVINDANVKADDVKRVLYCSGKIYYELLEKQQKEGIKDVAIVRVEQLYPTPLGQMEEIFKGYKNANDAVWVQEEPENMGAWPYLLRKTRKTAFNDIEVISRKESSSTATGYAKQHADQQAYILAKAFELPVSSEDKKIAKKSVSKVYNVD
ncbi:2-oxoglutarate dehydrogenase [Pedobacter antarcticus 4BY]|uniref:oxoglutarate dehydrogenase (succinyl-transferring) n=2 Tax=Pedobacter antarcticus TaxID=34086 RepID=A0A081PED5_9SPHI|nr:2-oxoglutarate dehydrogenase E1 component [Pedobacter antarcticus]KEQ29058.1 2-oxoglutarate dehydrogenase [Pedobacter antarcticus 4BY]SFF45046.1 2-oxoglutarate dehydrogenase E1 component [Pedobacter antarcticus]